MQILAVESTELFAGDTQHARQIVRVSLQETAPDEMVTVEGTTDTAVTGSGPATSDMVEVELAGLERYAAGDVVEVMVNGTFGGRVVVAAPGWTVWMIAHFHYDPVWWNTQAAYTATWDRAGDAAQRNRMDFQQAGFELVRLHLETARRDGDYKFVLAEVDYLKPYWDSHPQDREYVRHLLDQGRLEIMGGTYNEPNTNLTTSETTIRNFVYGMGFQRDILGADPRTAWQLDAFGHDPQFPGLAAQAGLTGSSWARGPFHQWGPMLSTPDITGGWGDPSGMQFPAEFDWISPSGQGVLTHYMPAHYSAGWTIDSAPSLAAAENSVYELFLKLKTVSATKNILLPVGTDYTPPAKWVTDIHRDWNARYRWPRIVVGIPREFFAAVRAELTERDVTPSVQTRDMNPIYTGKDVSFVDTKQAQRSAEILLVDAEKFATIASLGGARYPHAALDKAWRQLVYGAHHDAITGSESDQVYLDLLTTWREAHDLARQVLDASLRELVPAGTGGRSDQVISVFNPSSWSRSDLVRVSVPWPADATGIALIDPNGDPVPFVLEGVVHSEDELRSQAGILFRAVDVPSVGYRSGWRITPAERTGPGWQIVDGRHIANETFALEIDPDRGGGVVSLRDLRQNRELLQHGAVGNELLLDQEYPEHPTYHEGPWHLVPTGGRRASSAGPAESVLVEHGPLGQRVTVTGRLGSLRYTQQLTLFAGSDQLDGTTTVDGFEGVDELLRLRWPIDLPGALPVSEVASAVVGRGFGLIDVDSGAHPWTLDNPACNWCALSSTARVRVRDSAGTVAAERAIGVVELIGPNGDTGSATRELAVALVGQGVTSTASRADGPRYGDLAIDSNLPDFRMALGGPSENSFVAELLARVDAGYLLELESQLASGGTARLFVPAAQALHKVWVPSADLRDVSALPVLIIVGDTEIAAVADDVGDAVINVRQPAGLAVADEPSLDDYTVALLNRGVPSFAVDATGALHLSLLRSCTGWPSGVWIDPPRRTAPDGSNFQQEHWSHSFDYALVGAQGDWRAAGLVARGHDYNHALYGVTGFGAPTPARRSFLAVEPAGEVVLQALKVTGNPLAAGGAEAAVEGVTVRLHEAHGATVGVRLDTDFIVTAAGAADILEQPSDGAEVTFDAAGVELTMTPMQIATLQLATLVSTSDDRPLPAPDTEPHQPVYSRYWLNNTGPAPMGNLPVSVHVDPQIVTATGRPVTMRAVIASNFTAAAVSGSLEVHPPSGWAVDTLSAAYALAPGAFAEQVFTVTPADDTAEGVYWVRVSTAVDGQTVEDIMRVLVGRAPEQEFTATLNTQQISVRPGSDAQLMVTVMSNVLTPISVQAQLVSPWHTWDFLPHWNTGISLAPGVTGQLSFPVTVPNGARPGAWWALVKLGAAGVLHYTAPVSIEVRG